MQFNMINQKIYYEQSLDAKSNYVNFIIGWQISFWSTFFLETLVVVEFYKGRRRNCLRLEIGAPETIMVMWTPWLAKIPQSIRKIISCKPSTNIPDLHQSVCEMPRSSTFKKKIKELPLVTLDHHLWKI